MIDGLRAFPNVVFLAIFHSGNIVPFLLNCSNKSLEQSFLTHQLMAAHLLSTPNHFVRIPPITSLAHLALTPQSRTVPLPHPYLSFQLPIISFRFIPFRCKRPTTAAHHLPKSHHPLFILSAHAYQRSYCSSGQPRPACARARSLPTARPPCSVAVPKQQQHAHHEASRRRTKHALCGGITRKEVKLAISLLVAYSMVIRILDCIAVSQPLSSEVFVATIS